MTTNILTLKSSPNRWLILAGLVIAITLIFIIRTALAQNGNPPRLFELFDTLAVAGSLIVLATGYRRLKPLDWLVGSGAGAFISIQLLSATLFSPYPLYDIVYDVRWQAILRGLFAAIAAWGGLAILRIGGPVRVRLSMGEWRKAFAGLGFGIAIGLPFSVLNVIALVWQNGRPIAWQNPLAAVVDALQPAIYEDLIYRLALLSLLWLVLRRFWPDRRAALIAGILITLIHSYAHLGDLFRDQPLLALGMGTAMALVWGAPMTVLALRRDLESSIGFHWIQDTLRFVTGF